METTATRCPRCGSEDVLPIVYGYPGPELDEESLAGRVVLGGCLVGPDSPEFHCKVCEHDWRTSPA